ncbi:hypothetical protein THASP1DRAFT_28837 [Thamnocephalis sphaerospora]|uniref:Chitobiosyldiphosphodolichol beta-mannosyltransferase n=1 Tax=Thamnocephalis sphaerospora TaxID=78915 RepID=A0A4P9XTQ0_9FUNG|nr:hypothetical protein THASP1DRAFT_28837 [Thamnocephalis sphaerospora]|eukprot:RKP09362.1 hypothetical protein THASP1DRAFT_28837 [Thamnocephalis sphaerospora]
MSALIPLGMALGTLLLLGVIVGGLAFAAAQHTAAATATAADVARKRVLLVVLGDLGHSPRMQYHARSLASHGYTVDMVGYAGAKPLQELVASPQVHIHYLATPPRLPPGAPKALFLAYAPFKVLFQLVLLTYKMLFAVSRPRFILIQNPPAIPVLAVARLTALMRGAKLIIDWHNFGYTILGLNLGLGHPVVRIAEWYERVFGGSAYAHFCVTNAMAEKLRKEWQIRQVGPIFTLYDRAPKDFHRLDINEMHAFTKRVRLEELFLNGDSADTADPTWQSSTIGDTASWTLLTEQPSDDAMPQERSDRPALLVSATSWTADEDFSILLDAMIRYDAAAQANTSLPALALVITGKGPLKEHYEGLIRSLTLKRVRIATAWLAIEDYPLLLGAADLGVSLHASSSGLDLPMKVVDMFGCGLPVCALSFQCINELVQPNATGMLFDDASQLTSHFQALLSDFSGERATLHRLRHNVTAAHQYRWAENWDTIALPLFATA